MSAPAWMPLYIGDYIRDTRRLRAAEHGAYLLLIMEYWQTRGQLPDDDRQLARIAGMTDREWKAARPLIEGFFQPGWKHKRIDEELAKADAKSEKRADAGKRGGIARAIAMADAKQNPSNVLASSSQPQSEEEPSLRSGRAPRKTGTRLAADWRPSPEDREYAISRGMPPPEIDRHAEEFRNYWTARPGKDAVKLDWPATWRNRVLQICERKGWAPSTPAGNGHARDWAACLGYYERTGDYRETEWGPIDKLPVEWRDKFRTARPAA